jgi:hypothetical protein
MDEFNEIHANMLQEQIHPRTEKVLHIISNGAIQESQRSIQE